MNDEISAGWILLQVTGAAWLFYVGSRLYDHYHMRLNRHWSRATYRLRRMVGWAGLARYRTAYPPHRHSDVPWRENKRV